MKPSDKEFIAECEELLEEAGSLLLDLQDADPQDQSPDTLNALFRIMHTLKGLAGLYGITGLTELAHCLESLLDDIRMGKAPMDEAAATFILKKIDAIKSYVEDLKSGRTPMDVSKHVAEIEAYRLHPQSVSQEEGLEGLIPDAIRTVLSEYEEHRLKTNIKDGKTIYMVKTSFSLMDFDTELKITSEKLKTLGELVSTMPTSEGVSDGCIGFNLVLGSRATASEIAQAAGNAPEVLYQKPQREAAPAKADEEGEVEGAVKATSTTLRVDIQKLDRILNTIGDLTMSSSSVKSLWVELHEQHGQSPLLTDLHRVSQALDRRLAELRNQVLEIRMVPVGNIFGRLAQVVRRYSRQVDKHIRFEAFGEETEIDKSLAEEILDPLIHIIRNSIDHGLEAEERRREAGKPIVGRIQVKAIQQGNSVLIKTTDDGAGVDVDKVRQKGISKGILQPNVEYSTKEILDVMFEPGFSTKDAVSEVSGRGVGLDIVRQKILAIGGHVRVESTPGEGTTFYLTMPITLAIIKALMLRVGRERFAIPLSAMSESIPIDPYNVESIKERKVLNLRGSMLPLVSLAELFGIQAEEGGERFAVVVGLGERRIGLLVDELMSQHEIVIKSLGDYMVGARGFAGAAELGRNEVVLILDAESIIDESLALAQK